MVFVSPEYIFPHSAKAKPGHLATVAQKKYQSCNQRGEVLSHVVIGDFNPDCWAGDSNSTFHEWLIRDGIWELTDPSLATFKTGSAIDKVLIRPKADVPEEWLGPTNWADESRDFPEGHEESPH